MAAMPSVRLGPWLLAATLLGCGGSALKGEGEECVASSECQAGLVCDLGENPSVCRPNLSIDAPVDAPDLDAPDLDAPDLDAPAVDAPAVDAPVVDAPVVDAPAIDAPAVDAPAVDAPDLDAAIDAPPDA